MLKKNTYDNSCLGSHGRYYCFACICQGKNDERITEGS